MARLEYDLPEAETQFKENDVKSRPLTGADYPNGARTMQIGDYTMPQMGVPSDYKEKKR